MDSALVISRDASGLETLLKRAGLSRAVTAETGEQMRGALSKERFDLYIIDVPDGEKLAVRLAENVPGEVILLVGEERFFEASARLLALGVITLADPADERSLWTALKTAEAAHSRITRVQDENQRLVRELEDMKVINRAKLVLVSRLKMTEPEAHKYVEKQAMDLRASKREVAESILKTHEY